MEIVGLEFIGLECHSSIKYAHGNDKTPWHVSVRRPTPLWLSTSKDLKIALCTSG